jgi:hypothetical protein
MTRMSFWGKFFAYSLLLLGLPTLASAQYRNSDDDYYRNNRRNEGRYDRRYLADAVQRVEQNSRSFRRALDRNLDNSRYNETRREDRINDIAERFERAANDLENSFDNSYSSNNGANRAREVLQIGAQIDRIISRNSFYNRVEAEWSNIRNDLQIIARGYGLNFNNRNNDNYRRGNDDYRRPNRRNGRWGGI